MHFPYIRLFRRCLIFGRLFGLMISCQGVMLAQADIQTPSPPRPSALALLQHYDSLASAFYRSNDAEQLYIALQKGGALANKIHNVRYRGIFFFHKSLYLKRNQQLDSALIYADKALPILQQFKKWMYVSRLLYLKSTIYLDTNEPVKAVQNLFALINFNEKHTDQTDNTGSAYSLLAYTFDQLNDSLNQKKYLLKHLELAKKQGSDLQQLHAFAAWAYFLMQQKQHRQAHLYFVKARRLAERQKNDYALAEILNDMGDNFVTQKEYQKGLKELQLAKQIALKHFREPGWKKVLANTYTRTSSLYLSMEKPKEALDYTLRAFELVKGETDAHEFLVSALENRIAAQKALGQYQNALNSYEQLRKISQAVDVSKDREIVKNMEAKYRLDKIQKEKELYQKNLEIKELALQNEQKQSRLLGVLLIFLTLMGAGGYWLFRKNQLYNQRISRKNRQLELLNETKDKLFSIIGHDLRAPVADLNNSLTLIEGKNITIEQFYSLIGLLRKKTASLQGILNNLLYWALSQRHILNLNPRPIPLPDKIEEALETLHGLIQEKSLRIEGLRAMESSPVYADENHVQIVLYNVIHNAIKFSPLGERIHFIITADASSVSLQVVNSGSEFEWDGSIEKLSASQFGTLNEKGTGLGLLVCAELMKLNRGSIRACGTSGSTTLELIFPKAMQPV